MWEMLLLSLYYWVLFDNASYILISIKNWQVLILSHSSHFTSLMIWMFQIYNYLLLSDIRIQMWDVSSSNFIWNQTSLGNLPAEKQSTGNFSSGLEDENKILCRLLDASYYDQTWLYTYLCVLHTLSANYN